MYAIGKKGNNDKMIMCVVEKSNGMNNKND